MSLFSFSGKRPDNLGINQGKLLACPGTPNCVSSQADASDKEHFIDPIVTDKAPGDAIASLKAIIKSMERSTINEATDNLPVSSWGLWTTSNFMLSRLG